MSNLTNYKTTSPCTLLVPCSTEFINLCNYEFTMCARFSYNSFRGAELYSTS